jgi:hypothetical protein
MLSSAGICIDAEWHSGEPKLFALDRGSEGALAISCCTHVRIIAISDMQPAASVRMAVQHMRNMRKYISWVDTVHTTDLLTGQSGVLITQRTAFKAWQSKWPALSCASNDLKHPSK